MVVRKYDMTRVRERGRVPVQVELLNTIVPVSHDHGGSGCRAASRTVQPSPKRYPVRVELDLAGLVRRFRAEHGRIISARERGVKHPGVSGDLVIRKSSCVVA